MCSIDDAEYSTLWTNVSYRARKPHRCDECNRTIHPGETYEKWRSLYEGLWSYGKVCAHCKAAGRWLDGWCGGWLRHGLTEELGDHWAEGYHSIQLGRILVGIGRRWRDGADPIPVLDRRAWPLTGWKGEPLGDRLEAGLARVIERQEVAS